MKKFYPIIIIVWFFLLFWIYKFSPKTEEKSNPIVFYNLFENKHNWKNIDEILTKQNYDKVWINPDKYTEITDFLKDLNSYSWMTIDTLKESFVINIKSSDWKDMFIPFDFTTNNNDNFKETQNKNLAILDIYSAYKSWWIYGWNNSLSSQKVIFDYEFNHPLTSELNKIFSSKINVFDYIKTLENTQEIWIDNKEILAYLYDFTWNYSSWNILKNSNCNQENCKKEIIFSWKVSDESKKPIKWTKIEILNNPEINTTTDENWNFELKYKVYPFSHIRLKASIDKYSDWFSNYSFNYFNSEINEFNVNIDFNLHKFWDEIIVDKNYNNKNSKYYIIETKNSKYFVPIEWLFFENWEKYLPEKHNFKVYLYQFTKDSNMTNLLENDTFEPVYWYVWNIMKTFWMPYIQIIDQDTKKEIFTKSSTPMILQNQIYHMKELYENHDKIYTEITKKDMEYLVEYSNNSWNPYPIDFEFLTKNEFLRWPAWWVLDRKTWIWSNIWHRVINVDWLVELPFFHIKDN